MWKPNLVVSAPTIKRLSGLTLLVMLGVAGCAPPATPFAEPTQTLIPPTLTYTPSPVPPTATLSSLPGPQDVLSQEQTPAAPDQSGLDDPVAAELVSLAQRRVAQDLNLPVRRIQVVDVQLYTWNDTSLGCPQPGQAYTPVQVDGYRIVLSAGDTEYIFHTDFDRVLACDAADEQLPEATPES